jgi:uncharacterized protein (DUF608 family)
VVLTDRADKDAVLALNEANATKNSVSDRCTVVRHTQVWLGMLVFAQLFSWTAVGWADLGRFHVLVCARNVKTSAFTGVRLHTRG